MSETKKTIEQKKSDILQISTKLFAEQGYEATTMANIAKLANVSFGSISTYFINKENLLYMCVEEPMEKFLSSILNFEVNPINFREELEHMTNMHFRLFQEYRIYLLLLVQMIAQNEKYYKSYLIAHEAAVQLTKKLEQLVVNGQKVNQLNKGNANTIAASYISLLFGLYLSNTDVFGENALTRFSEISIRLFGLQNNKGECI